jgi:RNA methyltransferase, TrmH family
MNVRNITSAANPTIKLIRSLDRKKSRRDHGLFVAEGARVVAEAFEFSWQPKFLLVTTDALERRSVTQLCRKAESMGAEILSISPRIMESISRRDNAQNVIGAFEPKTTQAESIAVPENGLIVILDRPRDPGNLGTIIRTADAVGANAVVLVGECVDVFSPEVVRASMGSLFSVPIVEATLGEVASLKTRLSLRIVGTSLQATDGFDAWPIDGRVAVAMGTEQSGLSAEMADLSDHLVRIPMQPKADSLNLAVSTGVILYDVWRRRGYEGGQ